MDRRTSFSYILSGPVTPPPSSTLILSKRPSPDRASDSNSNTNTNSNTSSYTSNMNNASPMRGGICGISKISNISKISKVSKKTSSRANKKVRSSKSNVPGESRYWTPSEHKLFIEALLRYGPKNLKDIAAYVSTRNMIQCRTHAQKCFMRLLREAQKETARRAGDTGMKTPKDMYSVSPSCGISLLCVVSEEMNRALDNQS